MLTKNEKLVALITRIGLAFVFLYAAISALIDPVAWIGFFPLWLRHLIPGTFLIIYFSSYQIFLAVWLMSSKKPLYASLLAAFTLLFIISANIKAFDIVFRDVEIFLSALALAALSRKDLDAKIEQQTNTHL